MDVVTHGGDRALIGELGDHRAAGDHTTTQQPVAGDAGVEAQQLFADAHRVGVSHPEGHVVAHRTEIGDVVVQAFELEQHGADHLCLVRRRASGGGFDGEAEGEVVTDGGV
ncbi:MAG: hypothetical protein FD127_968, partial [Acidimicrobiaceae bacterium]